MVRTKEREKIKDNKFLWLSLGFGTFCDFNSFFLILSFASIHWLRNYIQFDTILLLLLVDLPNRLKNRNKNRSIWQTKIEVQLSEDSNEQTFINHFSSCILSLLHLPLKVQSYLYPPLMWTLTQFLLLQTVSKTRSSYGFYLNWRYERKNEDMDYTATHSTHPTNTCTSGSYLNIVLLRDYT